MPADSDWRNDGLDHKWRKAVEKATRLTSSEAGHSYPALDVLEPGPLGAAECSHHHSHALPP